MLLNMSRVPKTPVMKFDEQVVDRFVQMLLHSEKVKVSGIGTFKLKFIRAKRMHNVGTGKMIDVAAFHKVVFRASKELSELVRKK